jgi:hypothetical protein
MNRTDMYNQMYARGDEVSSGRRPGTTGPNVQRNMPGRMTNVAGKVTGRTMPGRMSGMADRVLQNPRSTMATPKTGLLPNQTLSKMGTLSRGGLGGLVLAGGLGLFEIGRQTGFEPEKLGQAAAQVQKSLQEVANEAADVARELGQPIQDFVNRVVAGYQSEMGESDRLERMMMGGQGRTISDMDRDRVRIDIPRAFDEIRDMDIQERNLMQQEQLGFAEGGAVESEIDKALEDIQGVQPEAMVIQQVMTMVMEMIASGASEEQIVAALKQMGLDEEDIQQVMMMVAEEMAGQDSIDGQLAQMM